MTTLEIFNQSSSVNPGLGDFLSVIEPFRGSLAWYLIEFDPGVLLSEDGSSDHPPPGWVSTIWQVVRSNPEGLKLEWDDLKRFSKYVRQTDNLFLVAAPQGETPPLEPIDPNDPRWTLVLQAVDSTFWAITTRNQQLLDKVRSTFPQSKLAKLTERYY
jgi:hypothetical protein